MQAIQELEHIRKLLEDLVREVKGLERELRKQTDLLKRIEKEA